MTAVNGDYVLGTDEAEIERLGLQHRVWREASLAAWRRAGIRAGWRVADVGAGPGYATWDLAELVGPAGQVIAVERSDRFVAVIERESDRRRLEQVRVVRADLMDSPPLDGFDMTWCRWVASFVASVPKLVCWLRESLRAGGVAVFHEYVDYGSWRFAPPRRHLGMFVEEAMASWRAAGGEPDVAPVLIDALGAHGFDIRSAKPLAVAARPGDLAWSWPAGFIATGAARLLELGRVPPQWVDAVVADLRAAEADPHSVMVTPLVLEIIAQRR